MDFSRFQIEGVMASFMIASVTNIAAEMDFTQFQAEGVMTSFILASVVDIVEEIKYNTKEEALLSIKTLSKSKTNESNRIQILVDSIKKLENQEKKLTRNIQDYDDSRDEIEDHIIIERDNIIDLIEMKQKEFNNVFHNFIRETTVVDNIVNFLQEINFDNFDMDNFLNISSNIIQEYSKNIIPMECKCKEKHIGSDIHAFLL
jgi:hypothetical protein